jgi:hypothetical protein
LEKNIARKIKNGTNLVWKLLVAPWLARITENMTEYGCNHSSIHENHWIDMDRIDNLFPITSWLPKHQPKSSWRQQTNAFLQFGRDGSGMRRISGKINVWDSPHLEGLWKVKWNTIW